MKLLNYILILVVLLFHVSAFATDQDINIKDAYGRTLLMRVIDGDSSKNVESVLAEGVPINGQDDYGFTALMISTLYSKPFHEFYRFPNFKLLLNRGADVNIKNIYGETALMLAARHHTIDNFNLLIAKGADVHAKNIDGNTILMETVKGHDAKKVTILIEKGARINDENDNKNTALMFSNHKTANILLDNGANVNHKNDQGQTALIYLSKNGILYPRYIFKKLLDKGANIDEQDNNGDTALIHAARNGHIEIIKELIRLNANKNIENIMGKNALQTAFDQFVAQNDIYKRNHYRDAFFTFNPTNGEIKDLVTPTIATSLKINAMDEDGLTNLMKAAEKGDNSTVEDLLNKGALIDMEDRNGTTALGFAMFEGHPETVLLLLNRGADSSKTTSPVSVMVSMKEFEKKMQARKKEYDEILEIRKNHISFLMARMKSIDHVNLLKYIKNNVDINHQDKHGKTMLMYALENYVAVFNMILENGANIDLQDKNGNTALMHVILDNNFDYDRFKILIDHGADVFIENNDGKTVLDLAEEKLKEIQKRAYNIELREPIMLLKSIMKTKQGGDDKGNMEATKIVPLTAPVNQVEHDKINSLNSSSPTAPAPKKPGKAVIIPTTQDTMSLTAFTPDKKPDSCVQVVALSKSPLTAVRLESMGGASASWKTKDVKTKAQGVLAVMQDGKVVNAADASFTLDVTNETFLNLCVQDTGTIADAKTRLRVIFFHQDGSRNYAIIER